MDAMDTNTETRKRFLSRVSDKRLGIRVDLNKIRNNEIVLPDSFDIYDFNHIDLSLTISEIVRANPYINICYIYYKDGLFMGYLSYQSGDVIDLEDFIEITCLKVALPDPNEINTLLGCL